MGNTKLTITICILLVLGAEGSPLTDEKIIDAMNGFGINLFNNLINEEDNVFCSPLSATTLLNVLLTGASDDATAEIRNVLGYANLGLSTQQARSALAQFLSKLNGKRAGFVSGNSIWTQSGLKLGSKFHSIQTDLQIEEHEVDFSFPVSASGQIEKWIGNITHNKMLKFSSSEINPATKVLLASVVDFSGGTWYHEFKASKTQNEPFYINHGQEVMYVPMMLMSGYFKYISNIDLSSELIEIPYAGEDIAMVIILPKDVDGIKHHKELMSLDTVTQAIQEMQETQVHLRIPHFNVQSSLSLKRTLNSLGMVKYFTPEQELNGSSDVIQKTVISVSEKGSIPDPLVPITSGLAVNDYDHPRMTYYTVDHPFTFLIHHKPTGGILFIGQILKP